MIADMENDLAGWGESKSTQNMQSPIKDSNGYAETPFNRVDNKLLFSFQDLDNNGLREEEFARKVTIKLRILTDLLQIQAIQGKSNEPSRVLQNLFDELSCFITFCIGLDTEVDKDLNSCFKTLTQTFLESMQFHNLNKLNAELIRKSHEVLFLSNKA